MVGLWPLAVVSTLSCRAEFSFLVAWCARAWVRACEHTYAHPSNKGNPYRLDGHTTSSQTPVIKSLRLIHPPVPRLRPLMTLAEVYARLRGRENADLTSPTGSGKLITPTTTPSPALLAGTTSEVAAHSLHRVLKAGRKVIKARVSNSFRCFGVDVFSHRFKLLTNKMFHLTLCY